MSLTHVMYMYRYRRDENKTPVCHVKYRYQTFQNTCTKVLYRMIEIEFLSENRPFLANFCINILLFQKLLPKILTFQRMTLKSVIEKSGK